MKILIIIFINISRSQNNNNYANSIDYMLDKNNPNYQLFCALYLIYEKNAVIYNQKTNEKSFSILKSFQRIDKKKLPTFIVEVSNSPKHKTEKPYKILLSKMMKTTGKNYLFIMDISNSNSMLIHLESLFENPSKNHILDPQSGYAFVYDNKGNISIIVAKITGEWREKITDKDRKICNLTLFDKRIDPTLHLINKMDGSLLLFVVGGHENNIPYQDMLIFSINFDRKINLQPLLRVKLRYPRFQPLIYHMKVLEEKDTRIFILGGTSTKNLKKEAFKSELLEEGKKSCETINLKKIEENLYKKEIVGGKESSEMMSMDKSFQLFGSHKLIKKLDSFSEGAVIKLRAGFHAKNKTAFILGVGKSKASVYQIEYVDEKGQQLHIVKKLQKALAPGFLCNAMFRIKDKNLYYLADNNKEKYETIDLRVFEGKNYPERCHCMIF